ncbi:CerR family C-terminal domain-containing protein [Desulforegula conservatrix]|uniref:CerR family C-terminal domain-containing protein n=1 Tax=Desulforegula conservatrix TaxID=153026 RepID=UPI000406DFF7|nr:CerR family C-terminal domain-containing protein [Desulforegula conservatrix]
MKIKKSDVAMKKLLTAASDVFAEKGFRDSTVAEICKRAGANISAVNYYFGSKEALYQESWRHSFAESVRVHPQDGGVRDDAPAEDRLRGQVRALMARIADENNRDFFISQMEFVNPTGLLEEVMKSELIPLREKTLAIVRELLGPGATDEQILYSETCIISMCLHPMLIRRVRKMAKKTEAPVIIDDLGAFEGHVMKFALAGIASIRREIKTDLSHD